MWSAEDVSWLNENYPALKRVSDTTFEGALSFRMIHKDGSNTINPSADDFAALTDSSQYISDTFRLKVEWAKNEFLPKVYDLSGRILATAEAFGKSKTDLHLMPDDSFCLGSSQDLNKSFSREFSADVFINEYLVPFLYAQTYYSRHREWPWGELSHGPWGLLEWLGDKDEVEPIDVLLTADCIVRLVGMDRVVEILSTRCRSHKPCPCNSGKTNWHCHPRAKDGIARLRGSIARREFRLTDFVKEQPETT